MIVIVEGKMIRDFLSISGHVIVTTTRYTPRKMESATLDQETLMDKMSGSLDGLEKVCSLPKLEIF